MKQAVIQQCPHCFPHIYSKRYYMQQLSLILLTVMVQLHCSKFHVKYNNHYYTIPPYIPFKQSMFFCTQEHSHYTLWLTDPDRGSCTLSEGKKLWRNQLVGDFSLFRLFPDINTTDWIPKFPVFMACWRKKCQSFFHVGDNFSSSEDSQTIEYYDCPNSDTEYLFPDCP